MVGLKAPLSWLGTFEASASQAFMSCGSPNPSAEQSDQQIVTDATVHQQGIKRNRDMAISVETVSLQMGSGWMVTSGDGPDASE